MKIFLLKLMRFAMHVLELRSRYEGVIVARTDSEGAEFDTKLPVAVEPGDLAS
jgi:isocitrate lyase